MEEDKSNISEIFRKFLVKMDVMLHVLAAILLLIACLLILYYGALNILQPGRMAILQLINDVLMSLIILELLWTVLRFLKKQKFLLTPFLAVGAIAAVRRILLIEAQTSYMEHVPLEKLYEIALSALIVLVMVAAYYIAARAHKIDTQ